MTSTKKNNQSRSKNKSLFLIYLKDLTDVRRSQGKRYEIEIIILIYILAIMSGQISLNAIKTFTKRNKYSLIKYLKPKNNSLPCKETIRTTLNNLDYAELSFAFTQWAKEQINIKEGDWLCFDGKAIKGTNKNSKYHFTTLVTMFVQKSKLIFSQEKVNRKTNEIPTVQSMIEELNLKKIIFIGDALHTQKLTIKTIVKNNNKYVLNVKKNQKTLLNKISFLAENMPCIDKYTLVEKNRGRIESREIKVFENDFDKDLEELGWIELNRIIRVRRTTFNTKTKKLSQEIIYFISNLKTSAKKFGEGIRKHWLVESMHWIKDVVFKEDFLKNHTLNGPENLSLIRSFVINILRMAGFESITEGMRTLVCRIKKMLNLIISK